MRLLGDAVHSTSQKVLQRRKVQLGQLFDLSMPHTCALFPHSATIKSWERLRKKIIEREFWDIPVHKLGWTTEALVSSMKSPSIPLPRHTHAFRTTVFTLNSVVSWPTCSYRGEKQLRVVLTLHLLKATHSPSLHWNSDEGEPIKLPVS